MQIAAVGLDISKHVFQIHAVNGAGVVVIQKRTTADAVDALVVDFFGRELELQLLAYHSCQEAADGVLLPIGFLHHPSDRRARGRLKHGYDAGLF